MRRHCRFPPGHQSRRLLSVHMMVLVVRILPYHQIISIYVAAREAAEAAERLHLQPVHATREAESLASDHPGIYVRQQSSQHLARRYSFGMPRVNGRQRQQRTSRIQQFGGWQQLRVSLLCGKSGLVFLEFLQIARFSIAAPAHLIVEAALVHGRRHCGHRVDHHGFRLRHRHRGALQDKCAVSLRQRASTTYPSSHEQCA